MGGEQSGFINDLGFETYNKILDEALTEIDLPKKQNNIQRFVTSNCLVDTHEKAYIPKEYISNSNERLKMYGLIEEKSKMNLFDEIIIVFKDRFGPPPKELERLIDVMKIKKYASKFGVDKIITKKSRTSFIYLNNNKNNKEKQKMVLTILEKLTKSGHKTNVKRKTPNFVLLLIL